jgi:class 3 adenylate cyclase
MRPVVGTPSCAVRHIGLALRGRLDVQFDDGRLLEVRPNDVFDIPPGHDAWVPGDEPFESVEIAGIYGFGRRASSGESYVASILVTDLVDSTRTLERLGPDAYQGLLAEHFERSRRELDRFRGVEVATTGDGLLATFDGAARAIRCASAIHDATRDRGMQLRAGVHTGEVEPIPGNIRGLAIHIAARVAALAHPGETLVSATTREVVAAEDIAFAERGVHELKGVAGERQLFAASVTGGPGR